MTLPKAVSDVSCSACEVLRPASEGKLAQACSSNDRTAPINSEPEGKNVDRDFIGAEPLLASVPSAAIVASDVSAGTSGEQFVIDGGFSRF
jgi:hypothetical protein